MIDPARLEALKRVRESYPTFQGDYGDGYKQGWEAACDMLESELRALAAEAGWISVEDRLPENMTPVSVACDPTADGSILVARLYANLGSFFCRGTVVHGVTRWQPLPPPPKPEAGRAD